MVETREQLGYCKKCGVQKAIDDSFLGTVHCGECYDFVRPATLQEVTDAYRWAMNTLKTIESNTRRKLLREIEHVCSKSSGR